MCHPENVEHLTCAYLTTTAVPLHQQCSGIKDNDNQELTGTEFIANRENKQTTRQLITQIILLNVLDYISSFRTTAQFYVEYTSPVQASLPCLTE